MRGLNSDSEYFAFLDELRDSGTVNTVLAATYLVREFPGLRDEEAKAVCADWRATYGFQIYELPAYEESRSGILYAQRVR